MSQKVKKAFLWFIDLLINAIIIVGLVIVIQNWVIAPFDVSGSSMCPTLNIVDGSCQNGQGEKIIINAASVLISEPDRGDIVVFKSKNNTEKYFIKRIIGLPGETISFANGEVFVNGEQLKEDYLNDENAGKTQTYFSDLNEFTVPMGEYFLLGDNRKSSTDSRSCFETVISLNCKNNPGDAFVPRKNLAGKASFVWWPLGNMRIIEKTEYNVD